MIDISLADLGWSAHFASHLDADTKRAYPPARISQVHRGRVLVLTPTGELGLGLPPDLSAGDLAPGDWITTDLDLERVHGLIPRKTELSRKAAGSDNRAQLIAANVDTMMIVTSCNADFNPARLERYLALPRPAGPCPSSF